MIKSGRIGKHKAWELVLFDKRWIDHGVHGFYFDVQWRRRGQDHPGIGLMIAFGARTWIEFSLYDTRHAGQIPA